MDVFKKYEYYKPDKASMKKGVVNLKQGEVFLAKNKTEPGVIELENGIQYKVLKEGRGPLPKLEDVVGCIYKATLIDGTVFESSKGRPVQISIAPLIPGLASMLTTMHVGSRYSIVIPAPLAFRDKGKKPLVGPNSIVIYDVELIDIVPAATNKKHAT
jgi:FKBP-type peptidyl-prolyl cis-trans isomerase